MDGKDWKPFVQNQVNQIRSLTLTDHWQHCAGTENPADIPSREMDPHQLARSSLWLHGPDWSCDGVDPPYNGELVVVPKECVSEQKKAKESHSLLASTGHAKPIEIVKLIKCEDFSSKERLLRVTAQVLKCAKIWRKAGRSDTDLTKEITSLDLQEAETCWIRCP